MKVQWISANENGDFYVGYKVKVTRGIRGKTKGNVDEVLIVGVPKAKFNNFCIKEGIVASVTDTKTGKMIVYGVKQ